MDREQAFRRVETAVRALHALDCDVLEQNFTRESISEAVEEAVNAAVALAAFPDQTLAEYHILASLKLMVPQLIVDALDRAQHGYLIS